MYEFTVTLLKLCLELPENTTLHTPLTGKFANCAPEISKIYYKIYREHQNCAAEISVAQYKLSRLAHTSLKCFKEIHRPALVLNSSLQDTYRTQVTFKIVYKL